MRRNIATDSKFDDDRMGSRGEEASPRSPKRVGSDEDGAEAILVFERGVATVGAQKVAALELDMSESHLADHLRGDRTIAFHRVVRLCRRNPAAALVMLTELSRIAGLAPPQVIKKELTPEQKSEARRKYVHAIRAVALVHQAAVNNIADEMGVDAEAIDDMFDEVTAERRYAK